MENGFAYMISQLTGAMFGSWIVYLVYIDHYRQTKDEKIVLSTFQPVQQLEILKIIFLANSLELLFWCSVFSLLQVLTLLSKTLKL